MNEFFKMPLEDYAEMVEELVTEYDEFAKEYDYYGYCDAVEDVDLYYEELNQSIGNGDVEYLIVWLQTIVDEEDEYSERAQELIDKLVKFQR